MGGLWQWLLTAGLTVTGLLSLAFAYWNHWDGVYLLIAPLAFALAATLGALFAGLHNPYWAVAIMVAVLLGFVVVRYLNLFGIGAVV